MAVIDLEYEDEVEQSSDKPKAIAQGKVEKKSAFKKLKESIFAAGPKEVKESIVHDVIFPSLRDFFADTLYTIVDVAIYGRGGGRVGRGRRRKGSSSNGVIDYSTESTRKRERRETGRSSAGYSLDKIFFDTREEADQVFDALVEELEDKGEVSAYYFYELAGRSALYTDHAWGWTSLEGTGYVRGEDGYALALPQPKQLKR